jgi:hypothetical protein
MPDRDEITEEGFGFFRGTWLIGDMPVEEAEAIVRHERQLVEALDRASADPTEFEQLASSAESGEVGDIKGSLRHSFMTSGLADLIAPEDDFDPLGGLEIGVAGLTFALSSMRCLTAASCRWHLNDRSWSDCPIVFFAAPAWRVEILAELISSAHCGLDSDRDMLKVYGSSISDMNGLAATILEERVRFRRIPDRHRPKPRPTRLQIGQLELVDPASLGGHDGATGPK